MTFVMNNDFDELTIGSDVVDELVADPTGQLLLIVYPTCESTGITVEIQTGDLEVDNTYILNSSELGMSEKFDEGAYRFFFKFIGNDEVVTEDKLYFIHHDIDCKLVKFYGNQNIDCLDVNCFEDFIIWPYIFFDLLKSIDRCSGICHKEGCSMWENLKDKVDQTVSCGCD